MLRMPQSLHAELARAAEREQISLNQYITNTLSSAIGRRPDGERVQRGPHWLPAAILAGIVVTVATAILAIVVLVLVWANGW
jgi:HicB family